MDPQSGKVTQKCLLPDMPEKRNEHTVDANIVCGGLYTPHDNCISLIEGKWKVTHNLTSERVSHSSWKVCEGVVLLGNFRGVGRYTAELVEAKTGRTKKLFDLEYGLSRACAIADDNSVIVTGGELGTQGRPLYSNLVTRYNMEGFVETLPNLLLGRSYHGCTSFVQNGKKVLLVAGGYGMPDPNSVGSFDDTEIFQDGRWRTVGKLPARLSDIGCGTLNNKVFLTGGPARPPRKDILTYNPDTEAWTKTSDMMVGRFGHDVTEVAWDDYSQFCNVRNRNY